MHFVRSHILDLPVYTHSCEGRRRRGGTRGSTPRNLDISVYFFFLETYKILHFPNIFKMKWPKSKEKLNFWGRWVWMPMNPTPPPQSKFRGDAPDSCPCLPGVLLMSDVRVRLISVSAFHAVMHSASSTVALTIANEAGLCRLRALSEPSGEASGRHTARLLSRGAAHTSSPSAYWSVVRGPLVRCGRSGTGRRVSYRPRQAAAARPNGVGMHKCGMGDGYTCTAVAAAAMAAAKAAAKAAWVLGIHCHRQKHEVVKYGCSHRCRAVRPAARRPPPSARRLPAVRRPPPYRPTAR